MYTGMCTGWGDVSLLSHTVEPPSTGGTVAMHATRSKIDMFSILQLRNPHGEPDAWYGNVAIDPSAGKKSVPPPKDKKGRKNLFQVTPVVLKFLWAQCYQHYSKDCFALDYGHKTFIARMKACSGAKSE